MESHVNKTVAFQIRSLRGDLTQEQMTEKVGMNQNAISRLENPYYGKATITTLKRIATAFDVGLIVQFVPFSELVNRASGTPYVEHGLRPEIMNVPSFDEEAQLGLFDEPRFSNVIFEPRMNFIVADPPWSPRFGEYVSDNPTEWDFAAQYGQASEGYADFKLGDLIIEAKRDPFSSAIKQDYRTAPQSPDQAPKKLAGKVVSASTFDTLDFEGLFPRPANTPTGQELF